MLDEITKTVRSQLYERVISPLSGTFILSWCIWNYRFLLVLLSEMSAPDKIEYFHKSLYPDLWPALRIGLLYPALTTVLLVFLYPFPARIVYEYSRKQQRALKEIRQKIDDETPLTREEAKEIRRLALEQSIEYEKEIAKQSADIARLKSEIEKRAGLNSSLSLPKVADKKEASEVYVPGQPSFEISRNPKNSEDIEKARLLLTGSQLMDHLIKEFLQNEMSFGKRKFLVLTNDNHVVVTLMPENLSGKGKHYEYEYDSKGEKSIYSEAERVKGLIKHDILSGGEK